MAFPLDRRGLHTDIPQGRGLIERHRVEAADLSDDTPPVTFAALRLSVYTLRVPLGLIGDLKDRRAYAPSGHMDDEMVADLVARANSSQAP